MQVQAVELCGSANKPGCACGVFNDSDNSQINTHLPVLLGPSRIRSFAHAKSLHTILRRLMREMDQSWTTGLNASLENATVTTSQAVGTPVSLEFRAPMHLLYVVVLVLSIAGNSMVIYVSFRLQARSSFMVLIFNLAVCDLLTPLLSVPFDIAQTENRERWLFGAAVCKLLWPLQTLFSTSSSLTLGVICCDRYRALTRPFDGPTRRQTVRIWIVLIHLASCLLVTPYFAVLKLTSEICEEKWPKPMDVYRRSYTMLLFLVQYALPLAFMTVLYPLALFKLFSSSDQVLATMRNIHSEDDANDHSRCLILQRRKQNLKVTKMFILVVVVFAISMFPNQVFWIWNDYGNTLGHSSINLVHVGVICRLFTYSNSVLNPVIYCFCSREFRAGFRRIGSKLSRRSKQQKHADNVSALTSFAKAESRNYRLRRNLSDESRDTSTAVSVRRAAERLEHSNHMLRYQQRKSVLIDNAAAIKLQLVNFVSTLNENTRQGLLGHFRSLKESNV